MPLFREWSSDPFSLAAIWEIGEPEDFFTARTGILSDIRSEKRRLEHLAGRFLLKHLKEDFPLLHIQPDEHDKPRLHNNQYFFSISHSYPFVAAVVSPYVECGIDIQVWHPRMRQLKHKFLSPEEQSLFGEDEQLLTIAWCAKEAAYKWQGRRGVEFIDHLQIQKIKEMPPEFDIALFLKLNEPHAIINLKSFANQHFAFSVVENSKQNYFP